MMIIKNQLFSKYFLNTIFILGILYGLMAARYALYFLLPADWIGLLKLVHTQIYFYSLIDRITFLLHVLGGCVSLILAPLVFISYRRDWYNFETILRCYFLCSILPMIWPMVFLVKAQGISIAYYLIGIAQFLWVYILARAYYFYRIDDMHSAITYVVYLYSLQFGAFLWRFFRIILLYEFPVIHSSGAPPVFQFNPLDVGYDLSWLLVLTFSIALAKIIMYTESVFKY